MGLSVDLISQFAKITNDKTKKSKETVMYGKAVKYGENIYVKLDGSDMLTPIDSTVEVINVNDIPDASGEPNVGDVEHGDKVMVTIRNHVATITGNIDSPAVRFDTVKNVSDKVDEQNSIINNQNTIINNQNSIITTIQSDVSTVKSTVNTQNSNIETLNSDVSTINSTVNTMNSTISTMKSDIEIYNSSFTIENDVVTGIKGIDGVEWINTETISANNAKIENLDAAYANIDKLVAEKATIEDLNAVNAKIENLEVTTADIGNLQADVAYINDLMFDTASGKSIQTSFSNSVIAQLGEAQIKSAMIDTLSASKIMSGNIYTNNVHVLSEDGKLLISDETIQISDENRVRVQIGKDAAGDYSINIWDTNGKLMFSEGGITDNAIKQAIIRNDMVSDTANISASKLDIASLFTEINQNGTETIKSNKIYLDDKAQTLNVAFTQMTTDVEDLSETVSSQGTDISVIQGQISSKVWQQDIDTATGTMDTKYSELSQTVDGINATVNNHTTKFSDVDKDIEYVKSNYATLEVTDEKIATQVKSITTTTDGLAQRMSTAESNITQNATDITLKVSQTEYDEKVSQLESSITQTAGSITSTVKSSIDELEIGGRNLFENSAVLSTDGIYSYFAPTAPPYTITIEEDSTTPSGSCAVCAIGEITTPLTSGGFYLHGPVGKYIPKMITGETYTVSVWMKCSRNINYGAISPEFLSNRVQQDSNNISTEWQRFIVTGTYNGHTTTSIAITFYYNSLIQSNDVFYISSPQIEKGNKVTDWSPAPEDMATTDDIDAVNKSIDSAEGRITASETLIQQLSDSISTLVVDSNGESLMTQTSTGWVFSTTDIQNTVNTTSENLNTLNETVETVNKNVSVLETSVNNLGAKTEWIYMGNNSEGKPCMVLGENDSKFQLSITNEELAFTDGANELAYFNNQSLYINKAVIEEELQQGEFVWKARSNGNLGLIWKEATS